MLVRVGARKWPVILRLDRRTAKQLPRRTLAGHSDMFSRSLASLIYIYDCLLQFLITPPLCSPANFRWLSGHDGERPLR